MVNKNKLFSKSDFVTILSFLIFIFSTLYIQSSLMWQLTTIVFLSLSILSSVHYAEVIAEKLGPSWGTLILSLAVTIIEVALIISLMSNKTSDAPTVARDTVFATIMIVTNGLLGVCIFLGGLKYKELGFQPTGTTSLLSVLAVLSTLTLVLPTFTITTPGPTYGSGQLIFVSVASLILYGSLFWAQTISHKNYFSSDTKNQKMILANIAKENISSFKMITSCLGLGIALITVVGLAKILSPSIEDVMTYVGAPKAVVGIIIALLVLAPETLAALKAAKTNELQTSLNLALGSGAASIALTIPAVSFYALWANQPLTLGLDSKSLVFLILTFITSSLTFGTGRATALNGVVHLIIMASYIAIIIMP